MKDFFADLVKRASSRKFLITLGVIAIAMLYPEMPDVVWQMAGLYLGVEGLGDIVARWRAAEQTKLLQAKVNAGWTPAEVSGDPDANTVVPGSS